METNIILAGVGGQGIVSISYVIDMTAIRQGLSFKQAEVHGMSQRGGAVQSHLRLSDRTIHSDLVPKGSCHIVLSVEPLESLRYIDYLSPKGSVVSSIDPFINIPDYPPVDNILDAIASLPNHTLVAADRMARQAGSGRAQNMVLLGAATPYLGLDPAEMEKAILEAWTAKGEKVQKINIDAFRFGRAAGEAYRACIAAQISSRNARSLVGRLTGGHLDADAVPAWKEVFALPIGPSVAEVLVSQAAGKVAGSAQTPKAVLNANPTPDALAALLFTA